MEKNKENEGAKLLFVSIDLCDSTKIKYENDKWEKKIQEFYQDTGTILNKDVKEFKNLGDERVLFTSSVTEIKSILDKIEAIEASYKIKTTIYEATIDNKINNIEYKINNSIEFLGKDIDRGFRLGKYAESFKVLVEEKAMQLISGTYTYDYEIKSVTELKGIPTPEAVIMLKSKEPLQLSEKERENFINKLKENIEQKKYEYEAVTKKENEIKDIIKSLEEDKILTDEQQEKMKNKDFVNEISDYYNKTVSRVINKIQDINNQLEQQLFRKVEFRNDITGKTVYVESRKNIEGKTETRGSINSNVFEQKIGEYIKYNSIIDAAEEIIKKGFKAISEEITTSKGKEIKYFTDDFHKSLVEKIKEKTKSLENKIEQKIVDREER